MPQKTVFAKLWFLLLFISPGYVESHGGGVTTLAQPQMIGLDAKLLGDIL